MRNMKKKNVGDLIFLIYEDFVGLLSGACDCIKDKIEQMDFREKQSLYPFHS